MTTLFSRRRVGTASEPGPYKEIDVKLTTGIFQIQATKPETNESSSRTGPTDSSLTVNLQDGGNAVPGTNYDVLPTSVTIPAGSRTAVLQVAAIEDSPGSNDPEDVNLAIAAGQYTIGSPGAADVYIEEQRSDQHQRRSAAAHDQHLRLSVRDQRGEPDAGCPDGDGAAGPGQRFDSELHAKRFGDQWDRLSAPDRHRGDPGRNWPPGWML